MDLLDYWRKKSDIDWPTFDSWWAVTSVFNLVQYLCMEVVPSWMWQLTRSWLWKLIWETCGLNSKIYGGHFDLRYQDIGGPVGSALIEFTGRLVWEPRISFSTFGLLSSRSLYLFASICYDNGPAGFYFNGFRPSNIISWSLFSHLFIHYPNVMVLFWLNCTWLSD